MSGYKLRRNLRERERERETERERERERKREKFEAWFHLRIICLGHHFLLTISFHLILGLICKYNNACDHNFGINLSVIAAVTIQSLRLLHGLNYWVFNGISV